MFIGHFGVGLGLKRSAPRVLLGTLFLSAQFVDLLWPTLLLAGWEHVKIVPESTPPLEFTHYPHSHSLLMVAGWAALLGGAYFLRRRSARGAVVVAAAVVSHWLLDLLVHPPDLPLWPGGAARVGFGGWASLPLSLAAELAVFGVGLALYLRTTEAANRRGAIGLWGLVVFLLAIQVANVFGAPPPSVAAVAWVGQAQWLLVAWAYWVDGHRRLRGE